MKLCATCQNKYADDANFCPREECAGPNGPSRLTPIEVPPARFVKVSRIGGGASGEVWQASDSQSGAAVAYKAVVPEALPTPVAVDRALRELRQLQRTSSPRIVKVVDFGKDADGRVFVATELAEGEPLDLVIARSGPFPLERAKRVVAQIGEALLDAQKVGVVHRDLSAKNVLVSGDDEVRVINFAIARPVTETLFGVPEFMSPEQAEGKLIDQRSNTYCVGALLYFMLTGQPPFSAATPQATIDAILKGEITPPSIRRGGTLTAEVDRVVLKALERNSSRRPLTLRQFLSDVAALIVTEQTAAATTVTGGREPAFAKTMMFAGGSQEVQKLVAQAVAAREAAATAGGATMVPPAPSAAEPPGAAAVGALAARAPTPAPVGGRATQPSATSTGALREAGRLPTGTPGPGTGSLAASRPSHGAAVAATMIAMPAATAAPAGAPPAATASGGSPAAGSSQAAGASQTPSPASGSEAQAAGSANFRETLWFKKGDVDQMVADARAKVAAIADARKSQEETAAAAAAAAGLEEAKPLEDRYVDDGTVTSDDRKNFSLRSGPTAIPAGRAGSIPGERMSDEEVLDEIGGGKRIAIIVIALAVVAALVAVVVTVVRGKGKPDGQKTPAAAVGAPTPSSAPVPAAPPPPVAPGPPRPVAEQPKAAAPAVAKPAPAAVHKKIVAKKKPAQPAKPAPPAKKHR